MPARASLLSLLLLALVAALVGFARPAAVAPDRLDANEYTRGGSGSVSCSPVAVSTRSSSRPGRPRVSDRPRARPPEFGNISYAHGWVTGAFLAPGREPVYVLPRMVVRFHLGGEAPDGSLVVREDETGGVVRGGGGRDRLAAADRARPARLGGDGVELLAAVPGAEFEEGSSLVNELRRVKSRTELELMAQACLIARERWPR